MTPQETHAAVVQMLQSQGVPLTTANLNRGMLALAQNDMSSEGAVLPPEMERSIARTTQRSASPQASGFLPRASPNQPKADVAPTPVPAAERAMPDGSASGALMPSQGAYTGNFSTTIPQPQTPSAIGAAGDALQGSIQSTIDKTIADPVSALPGMYEPSIQQNTIANSPIAAMDPVMQQLAPFAVPEAPDIMALAPLILGGAGRAIPPNLQLFLREKLLGGPGVGGAAMPPSGGAPNMIANNPTPRLPSPTQSLQQPLTRSRQPFKAEAADDFVGAEGSVRAPAASAAAEQPSLKKTLTARQKNAAQRSTRKTK